MIKVENIQVFNLEGAIRGMRFPLQSNDKSDSGFIHKPCRDSYSFSTNGTVHIEHLATSSNLVVGEKDLGLMKKLLRAGTDHSKYTRQILVSMDITAPLYWWKEMDTYKVATVANSESTMHKLASTPITKECFSFDDVHEDPQWVGMGLKNEPTVDYIQQSFIELCEWTRQKFRETKDFRYWRALIQLLPSSWNQKRHWTGNYANLLNMGVSRQNHKLREWSEFINTLKQELPYYEQFLEVLNER